jgi:phosphoribosylaminoimidazolecarboxamide formyltransferase/IMP cyclohydrolase
VARRAVVSVSDKSGVVEFARGLADLGFEVVSTGGTARMLEEGGVPVTPVSGITGAPEILGGRVKTLHPRIHGGILADRRDPEHERQLREQRIEPVDLVCIDLYPFERTVEGGADEDEAMEQIDVGGPAMLRAAAKNFHSVVVVPGPEFYERVLAELRKSGEVSLRTRRMLARAAFGRTAAYDARIAQWMSGEEEFPPLLVRQYRLDRGLRYGENPHQRAAYYVEPAGERPGGEQLQGKELSFNNLYDVDAARTLLADFGDEPACVIVKHANPCGAAVARTLRAAYAGALASDPLSAFGGIVALNAAVDGELAEEVSQVFTEVLVAPEFTPEAREVFGRKETMILLRAGTLEPPGVSYKFVTGGLLAQTADRIEDISGYRTVTRREPTPEQSADLLFAWRVARQVKSNAIVLAKDGATVGIGAGQMSRVDSAALAVRKAGDRARGAVAASDAFFPFPDGVEALADAGIAAVIQPGGSRRDGEVISAADDREVAMVFTGYRHFLH